MPPARATSPPAQSAWPQRVRACAEAQPLIDSRLSREGLRRAGAAPRPGAVYLGVGLCAERALSRAVPLDLLGLLLPAEAIRAACGARQLIVLIADRHALKNGFSPGEVEARAAAAHAAIARAARHCGLFGLSIVRASRMHEEPGYREAVQAVRRGDCGRLHEYAVLQLADALHLEAKAGGLLKVGWALRGAPREERRDEIGFDAALSRFAGDRVPFVYCKPGRSLTDAAPRVPPYVATEPETRLCLDPREEPRSKLAAAARTASPDTLAGYRRYLRALVYTYGRQVERLPRGPLEDRVEVLLRRLAPERTAEELAVASELARDAS